MSLLHTKEKLIYPRDVIRYRSTMPAQEGTEKSDTGAGTAKSLSVPQIDPVFSYFLRDGGEIYVYVIDTSTSKIAIMTLDDTSSEVAYACHTIMSSNVAHTLVWDAVEEFQEGEENEPNPFRELAQDEQAMRELNDKLAQLFYGE